MSTQKITVRSIFISDVHLGSTACQASHLLGFLKTYKSEFLYLNGDIIDGWALKRKFYWPQEHNSVVQKVLKLSKNGTTVALIVGNHDEFLRAYIGETIGNISILDRTIHTTADKKTFLLVHGDAFDVITKYHKWIAVLGDIGYSLLLSLGNVVSKVRAKFGFTSHWSLASFIKYKVKNAVQFISNYELNVVQAIRKEEVDGIMCGHIHHAEIRTYTITTNRLYT